MWSADGRHLLVADDHGQVLAFDGDAAWKLVGEARVGGAAKRMVVDEANPERALVACYDGRVWSIPRSLPPSRGTRPPFVAVDRRRGMWGINVAATRDRIAVPSFFDRACLLGRDASGAATGEVGPEPEPTYGCNWLALHPSRREMAVTHDDARIRVRDLETGALLRTLGPDTGSLCMGAAFHPALPLLATVDFYGELLVYDYETGRIAWRRDLELGPGISVAYSPCGRFLAAGGYSWRGRMIHLGADGLPLRVDELDSPNRGVVKAIAFASPERLLAATGDGSLVVHELAADRFVAGRVIRGEPRMELANGVAASPDGRVAYVVARDQTVRAFDLETGAPLATGLGHVRGVKTVHASECGRFVATGAYDRTVMIWSAPDLQVSLPPLRLANSGISGVRCRSGRVYACSFDGVVFAADASTGRLAWHVTAAEASEGR